MRTATSGLAEVWAFLISRVHTPWGVFRLGNPKLSSTLLVLLLQSFPHLSVEHLVLVLVCVLLFLLEPPFPSVIC